MIMLSKCSVLSLIRKSRAVCGLKPISSSTSSTSTEKNQLEQYLCTDARKFQRVPYDYGNVLYIYVPIFPEECSLVKVDKLVLNSDYSCLFSVNEGVKTKWNNPFSIFQRNIVLSASDNMHYIRRSYHSYRPMVSDICSSSSDCLGASSINSFLSPSAFTEETGKRILVDYIRKSDSLLSRQCVVLPVGLSNLSHDQQCSSIFTVPLRTYTVIHHKLRVLQNEWKYSSKFHRNVQRTCLPNDASRRCVNKVSHDLYSLSRRLSKMHFIPIRLYSSERKEEETSTISVDQSSDVDSSEFTEHLPDEKPSELEHFHAENSSQVEPFHEKPSQLEQLQAEKPSQLEHLHGEKSSQVELVTFEKPTQLEHFPAEKPSQLEQFHGEKPSQLEVVASDKPTQLEHFPIEKPSQDITSEKPVKDILPVQSYNLAPYVSKSETLQNLVKLGVNLSRIEKQILIAEHILKSEFVTEIYPYLLFLKDIGIEDQDIGKFVSKNPRFFMEPMENLKARVYYLRSKKFLAAEVSDMLVRYPKVLQLPVDIMDKRLGELQKAFKLTGDEVRAVVKKLPLVLLWNSEEIKHKRFHLMEFLGFSQVEVKKMFLVIPRLFTKTSTRSLDSRFEYLHKVMELPHNHIVAWPNILDSRHFIIDKRHRFLLKKGRAQYDKTKANYVSLRDLVSFSDEEWCQKVAKCDVQEYDDFLKLI